jgi:hypothetical protein
MIAKDTVALYARVSSESQARNNTIGSQIAALRERIAADGFQLEPDHTYVDEGYSGAILFRPALERLRDAVAAARSHASMSMLRTGLPAVTPIKCSWSTSFAARAQRLLS